MKPATPPVTTHDLIRVTAPESTDPAYLAWKKAKIEAALKDAQMHPETSLSLEEVWRKHGLAG